MFLNCSVKNFRGFQNFELSQIAKVNVITGRNNVGKTALLEALFILAGQHNPDLTTVINNMRGTAKVLIDPNEQDEYPWDSVFYGFTTSTPMELSADIGENHLDLRFSSVREQGELLGLSQAVQRAFVKASMDEKLAAKILKMEVRKTRITKVRHTKRHPSDAKRYFLIFDSEGKKIDPQLPPPPFLARYHVGHLRVSNAEEATRFGRLQLMGKEDLITRVLQVLEPRLKSVAIVVEAGEARLQGDIGVSARKFVPMHMMGEGMARLANIVMLIAATKDGVLLVDDFDGGLHYSSLPQIWKSLREALDLFNVQLFATTHRSESVASAHEAFADADSKTFLVHRLERTREGAVAATYDKEAVEGALEAGLELR